MKKIKTIPIKTIQVVVDDTLYQRLKKKKGNRNWYRFLWDVTEDD